MTKLIKLTPTKKSDYPGISDFEWAIGQRVRHLTPYLERWMRNYKKTEQGLKLKKKSKTEEHWGSLMYQEYSKTNEFKKIEQQGIELYPT